MLTKPAANGSESVVEAAVSAVSILSTIEFHFFTMKQMTPAKMARARPRNTQPDITAELWFGAGLVGIGWVVGGSVVEFVSAAVQSVKNQQ